jgi:predicted peptidase
MKIILLLVAPAFLLVLAAASAQPPRERTALFARKALLPYRLLQPDDYDPKKVYPLVVFLHGAGERGEDNEAQLRHGVTEFASPQNRKRYPCFVAAPQCPAGQKWADVDWGAPSHRMTPEPAGPTRLVLELIDQLQKSYPIDPRRIYLTGLSMGGFGTWDLLVRRPDLFAAAVPVCGGGDETQAAKIAHVPVWAFHGTLDDTVEVERSRNMIAALEKAGGRPRYTEYPDEGHFSWVPAYRAPEMMRWLFAQKRP